MLPLFLWIGPQVFAYCMVTHKYNKCWCWMAKCSNFVAIAILLAFIHKCSHALEP